MDQGATIWTGEFCTDNIGNMQTRTVILPLDTRRSFALDKTTLLRRSSPINLILFPWLLRRSIFSTLQFKSLKGVHYIHICIKRLLSFYLNDVIPYEFLLWSVWSNRRNVWRSHISIFEVNASYYFCNQNYFTDIGKTGTYVNLSNRKTLGFIVLYISAGLPMNVGGKTCIGTF
jgi:hypothetical protein